MTRNPDVLERLAPLSGAPRFTFEDLLRLRAKRQLARKIGAIAVVTAMVIALVSVGLAIQDRSEKPAIQPDGSQGPTFEGMVIRYTGGQLVAQDRFRRVGDDEMEAVVDHGLLPRPPVVVLDGCPRALALELAGEGHHRRRAAVSRRHRAGKEVIGQRHGVPHGLVEVAMRVDASGQHVASGGVDVAARRAETSPHRRDDATRDAEVGFEDVGRRGDHGIPDDRVELRHGLSSLSSAVSLRHSEAREQGACLVPEHVPR